MAQENQSETSTRGDEKTAVEQAPPSVIEISDSTAECEEEVRPGVVQMEEKAFNSGLHSFMKNKGTPIERIPHLGFKQINLWRIYRAVDKLGGYDSVTARRLWKKVYDELGGSPGSTSAATCTRRHYERLVLPFERHLKGEEDKPLPPTKPRKPYKRNLDGKIYKANGKRKKTLDKDSELFLQRSPEASCQRGMMIHPHSVLWAASPDRPVSKSTQPKRASADLCASVYTHILQAPTSTSWIAHIPPPAGEVISPLEKKKRVAQASLHSPRSSESEDKNRPSVIHRSPSPGQAPSSTNSDGSPLPLSSSSSRSPSPLSVSSEDGAAPVSSSELTDKTSDCSKEGKPVSTSQTPKHPPGRSGNITKARPRPPSPDSVRQLNQDSAWRPYSKAHKYFSYPLQPLSPYPTPASTSSFTKVPSKSVQLLRPAPIRPGHKVILSRPLQHVDPQTCAKRLHNGTPWPHQTDKRDKFSTAQQKAPPVQQSMIHPNAPPLSCDKSGRDFRYQPVLHPACFTSQVRLPQSQLMYRHAPVGPSVFGSAVYPYPYAIPLYNSQSGYSIPTIHPVYPHKL